jgi:hypothetical protein
MRIMYARYEDTITMNTHHSQRDTRTSALDLTLCTHTRRRRDGASALPTDSLGAGVFGDGLCAFTDGVLGEFTGQQEPHGSLHLPGRDGGPLVVVGQAGSFSGDALEDVVHERVHDGHGLAGDTGVGVDLLQHLVDVDGVTLLPLVLLLLFVGLGDVLLGFARLLGGFSTCLGRHFEIDEYTRATETEFSRSIFELA